MTKIEFLTILLTVNCFLDGIVSVTDKEFEVCDACNRIYHVLGDYFVPVYKKSSLSTIVHSWLFCVKFSYF